MNEIEISIPEFVFICAVGYFAGILLGKLFNRYK